MLYGEQIAIIGDLMEKESHRDGVLMGMEPSGRRSSQPRMLMTWRSTGVLTYIGEVSNNGMAMQLEITTAIGDVIPSSDVPSLELVSGDFIPH